MTGYSPSPSKLMHDQYVDSPHDCLSLHLWTLVGMLGKLCSGFFLFVFSLLPSTSSPIPTSMSETREPTLDDIDVELKREEREMEEWNRMLVEKQWVAQEHKAMLEKVVEEEEKARKAKEEQQNAKEERKAEVEWKTKEARYTRPRQLGQRGRQQPRESGCAKLPQQKSILTMESSVSVKVEECGGSQWEQKAR
jgi:hypothetical protein